MKGAGNMLNVILFTVAFSVFYFFNHILFHTCFSYDVEFNYGKHRMRNIRKKEKSFFRKFFFLDIRQYVIRWHYVCFWINFAAFVLSLIFYCILDMAKIEAMRIPWYIVLAVFFISGSVIAFTYNRLGNENIFNFYHYTTSKERYRKNNRRP